MSNLTLAWLVFITTIWAILLLGNIVSSEALFPSYCLFVGLVIGNLNHEG